MFTPNASTKRAASAVAKPGGVFEVMTIPGNAESPSRMIAVVAALEVEGAIVQEARPNRFRLRLPSGWLVSVVWHSGSLASHWDQHGRTLLAPVGQDVSGAEDPVRSRDADIMAWVGTTDDAPPPRLTAVTDLWWFPADRIEINRATPQQFFDFTNHLAYCPHLGQRVAHPIFGDGIHSTARRTMERLASQKSAPA